MKKFASMLVLMLVLVFIVSGCTNKTEDTAADKTYNYYTAEQTKEAIEKGDNIILLDIQVKEEWDVHHIKGAIPTHAYPVKTDEERAKLDAVLPQLDGEQPIVVICPGGAGGAQRTIDYLQTKGVKGDRLFILENGQGKWPYNELLEETATVAFVDDSYVVNVDWLKENLNREDLLILDARGQEAYDKGHIPGAIVATWQGFADMQGAPGDPNWGTVLAPKTLAEKLSALGITKEKEIVVYTNAVSGWGEDGRIVWMLRRAGFNNTKILDGGFGFWESKGYEVSKDAVVATPTPVELTTLEGKTNIETDELVSKLGKVVIIDVREKDEYEGATKFGEARGGHLPGAINLTFNQFLNQDGTLKTAQQIQTILDQQGIKKEDEIITYCTAGIRSAHMQIVLDMLGYENARNYDASFYAWAGNSELQLEK